MIKDPVKFSSVAPESPLDQGDGDADRSDPAAASTMSTGAEPRAREVPSPSTVLGSPNSDLDDPLNCIPDFCKRTEGSFQPGASDTAARSPDPIGARP